MEPRFYVVDKVEDRLQFQFEFPLTSIEFLSKQMGLRLACFGE